MLDSSTSAEWRVELYSDNYWGKAPICSDDYTTNLFVRLTIPLFTPRVNFAVWGNLLEYYRSSPEVNRYRRILHDGEISGSLMGDIYISTNIMLLTQERQGIDGTLRIALKSASGGDYEYARYYDNAAYFFDASFGREFAWGQNNSLKAAASAGFPCWQTDNGRQNDAVMYGAKGIFHSGRLGVEVEYG